MRKALNLNIIKRNVIAVALYLILQSY